MYIIYMHTQRLLKLRWGSMVHVFPNCTERLYCSVCSRVVLALDGLDVLSKADVWRKVLVFVPLWCKHIHDSLHSSQSDRLDLLESHCLNFQNGFSGDSEIISRRSWELRLDLILVLKFLTSVVCPARCLGGTWPSLHFEFSDLDGVGSQNTARNQPDVNNCCPGII